MPNNEWWPNLDEYNPGITKDTWIDLINNNDIFKYEHLCMLKRFLHIGGEATVSELANTYGKTFSAYISFTTAVAQKIQEATNCPFPPTDSERRKLWPILFIGRNIDKNKDEMKGTFIWKLRPELEQALNEINILSNAEYSLYEFNDKWLELIKGYKKLLQVDKESSLLEEEYKWNTIIDCKGKSPLDVLKYLIDSNSNLLENISRNNAKELLDNPNAIKIFDSLINDDEDLTQRFKDYKTSLEGIITNKLNITDERSISCFLACSNPSKYTYYKNSYYVKLCEYLDIPPKKAGEKIQHYYSLLDDFINIIKQDKELIDSLNAIDNKFTFSLPLIAQNIIYVVLESQQVKPIKFIEANISWNSKGWKEASGDVTNFGYTQIEGNIPQESWNFDLDNQRNTKSKLFGFAQFPKAPKNAEENRYFVIFRSNNKIIGFYGNTEIYKTSQTNNFGNEVNLVAQKDLSLLLDTYIDDSNHDFLFGNKLGRANFNYINKENSIDIINKAIELNPNQTKQLEKIKDWISNYKEGNRDMEDDIITKYAELLKHTRNLILHGAPGTGKSYLAKAIADKMGCSDKDTKFVQFQPSFDYVNFVEGLQPFDDGNGNITIQRVDGVFKKFCKDALKVSAINKDATVWKVSLEGSGQNKTKTYCLENNQIRIGWFEYGDIDLEKETDFKFGGKDQLTAFYKYMKVGDIVVTCYTNTQIDAIGVVTGDYEYNDDNKDYPRCRDVKWLVTGIEEDIKQINDNKQLPPSTICKLGIEPSAISNIVNKYKNTPYYKNNFVFIIDEINRGDLSKIMGELFYSIEPGYRGIKGKVDTQFQNLIKDPQDPYINGFYIPENVYIIGTMNDIDRSVESMDFAFRRRFTFKEIKANENLGMLNNIEDAVVRDEAINKLVALNEKISAVQGLGSSYHIGGAYFLKLNELEYDFDKLWEYHLEGLLREYLRGLPNADAQMKVFKEAYDNADSISSDGNDI